MNSIMHLAPWKRSGLIALLLAVATLLAYQPAWHGAPVFDDDDHLTPPELSSGAGLWRIWSDLGAVSQYYPITHSAFWLQHHLFGETMLGYHAVNILLHALAAWLLGSVLQRLAVPGAWLAAAVFALHPVHVESVAWISELKNTLSGVLYLGAAMAYLRFDASRARRDHLVALLLFVGGLLAKSVVATLPAALLVIFWWQRGSLSWRRDVRPLLPFFGLGIGAGAFTAWVERTLIGAAGDAFALTALERGLVAGRAAWFYLGKLLWPAELIFIYPRWDVSAAVAWQYAFPAAAAAVLAVAWAVRRRTRGPLAVLLFFGGTLFPVLGFLNVYPFLYSFVADHYQYLASIGIIAALAAGVSTGLARGGMWGRASGNAVCGLLLALLAGLTWRQSRIYADTETLWTATLAKNPACWVGHSNLANYLLPRGRTDEAVHHGRRAVDLRPNSAEAHNNLGNALRKLGRTDEALLCYRRALEIRPALAAAHFNLGVILLERRESDAALAAFEKAIAHEPEFVKARNNLGSLLLEQGRVDEAIVHIEKALAVRPQDPDASNNLGNAWLRKGDPERALAHYQKALAADPTNIVAQINLGSALLQSGRVPEALAQLRRALEGRPDSPELHASLGQAFAQQRRFADAIGHFETSLRLRPADAATHNDLGSALAQTGQTEQAYAHFMQATELRPAHEAAQFNLGCIMLDHGRLDEAIDRFRKAIAVRPEFTAAHYQMANALLRQGHLDAAISHFQKVVQLEPGSAPALNDLGVAYIRQGNTQEALTSFRRAVEAGPDFADAHANLGRLQAQMGRGREALTAFQAALKLRKDDPDTLLNLAWLLATSRDATVRNGQHAIYLVQRAGQAAGGEHPGLLRTLAAAYAEAGRIGEAVATAEQALARATEESNAVLRRELQSHLALYRVGTPLRDPPENVIGGHPL